MELGLSLQGVISMRLLPHASGKGRIPALEIMVGTPLIRKLLHEGKTLELPQYIEQGGHVGMQTFNQSLLKLYQSKTIRMEDALAYATSPDEFRLMAEGIATGVKAREFDSIYR
jgi:Tfp pilus assembly ATPase PilU